MNARIYAIIAAAGVLASTGCTSIVGGIDFNGSGGGTTASSSGAGPASSASSSASGTGGASSSSSAGGDAGAGTGGTGTGGASSSSSSGGPTCANTTCEANATCSVAGGTPTCACNSGFVEFPAGTCIPDPCQPDPCNGNGTCSSATGAAECTCNAPFIGTACDTCVHFVDGGATAGGDGTSWAKAYTKIQPALDAANTVAKTWGSCDVWVKAGTYYLFVNDKVKDGLHLYSDVGLYGGFAGTETTRSAADPVNNKTTISGNKNASGGPSVEHVAAGYDVDKAAIDGFTLRDGNADGSGGNPEDSHGGGFLLYGFNNHTANAKVSRCEITANAGGYGAGVGMIWNNPSLTITASDIHGNTASGNAGGMECASGGSCTVTGTKIRSNAAAQDGGGLHADTAIVADSDAFSDNVAGGNGGGLLMDGTSAGMLTNLTFSGNYAGDSGGGLSISNTASAAITNAVFVGNGGHAGGGAINVPTCAFTCIACTLTGNSGGGTGDAILWASDAPTLINTIVWGNPSVGAAASGVDVSPATWASITTSHSDVHGFGGTDTSSFDANPLFVRTPLSYDWATSTGVSAGSVTVGSGSSFSGGDFIEIGGDGTSRVVTTVSSNVVGFSPPLSAPAAVGTAIRDWGPSSFGTLNLKLSSSSMCTAAGDPKQGLSTDITGASWNGNPTIGAYSSP